MTDCDRVLGQIARGEVRAGREAAREIAAKHEKAYGRTVWPKATDVAWAEAVAALDACSTKGGAG
ncbi:hypothetical protein AB0K71_06090 [Streptomyces syringium]|uniref:hypothetical protein n=1 Tax=Streptomyces syringium TaxID=76729 RepID=UPI0034249D70